jgi:hypothetical protein
LLALLCFRYSHPVPISTLQNSSTGRLHLIFPFPIRTDNSFLFPLSKAVSCWWSFGRRGARGSAFREANKLEMVSISLDTDKEKWMDAVEQDNLSWEHHLSDLKGWNGAAVDSYQVESIPSSFLVDQNGIIIGKNLHARDLDKLLSSLSKP